MQILDYMGKYAYEQLVVCCNKSAGLRAIIAIHDTTLGPALGGCRMWPYPSEDEAILDVLRLARAMTYKSAAAGLNLGGGKTVLIGDPARDKTEHLFRALGWFVESLKGRYIVTEDVGTTVRDMEWVRLETRHVTGLPLSQGGSGDPSALTAFGVYQGMRACAREVFGSESLAGKKIAIQGFGKVGSHLAQHLHDAGAHLIISDVSREAAQRAKDRFAATVVTPDAIYDTACDIFSPCALGGILNSKTIPRLECRLVVGGANNQLLDEEKHADELRQRGILYAPDYILNAGGVINLSFELTGYNAEAARAKTAAIYHTMEHVIATARRERITTSRAAARLAEERLEAARRRKRDQRQA